MPNHVTNKLHIDAKNIDEIFDFMGDGGDNLIDFNKIIPMPADLHVEEGTLGSIGLYKLTGKAHDRFFDLSDTYERHWDGMDEKRREECLTLGRQYLSNLEKYGHKTWYSWAIENWGTKWNAYSQSERDNGVLFDTAWSTPLPIFQALSARFPEATFIVDYADEDLGNNCGRMVFTGGELILQEEGDLQFACQVTGTDYEEYLAEIEEE